MRILTSSQISKFLVVILAFASTITFSINGNTQQLLPSSEKNTSFQKTDVSLLYDIENNLKSYDNTGNFSAKKQIKPPRQRRFELAKKGLHKLIYKNSMPNSLFGGTIGALATAHPTGLVLGGIAGLLQGKSHRYEEAQGKIHLMEREIFSSKPYELTDEEIRLALYTGADLSEFIDKSKTLNVKPMDTEEANILNNVDNAADKKNKKDTSNPEQSISAIVKSTPDVDYCHDLAIGNTKPVDNATRRELATFCYYHLN